MNSSTWQAIRALRAAPTGAAAADSDRRQTFSASLRQAEELAAAAQAVSYAAMPLPIFYSLSQAGRAIAAAYLPGSWRLDGHGLSVTKDVEKPLLARSVKPARGYADSFSRVAAAIDSPVLNGSAQLGALWAANPDLLDVPIPAGSGNWPPAIEIPIGSQCLPMLPMLTTEPDRDPERHFITTDGTIGMSIDLPGETGGEIAASLNLYPSLRDAFPITQGPTGVERAGPDDRIVRGMGHDRDVFSIAVDAPSS